MEKKRKLFVDYINGLFDIEFSIFKNNLPKLHKSERELLDMIMEDIGIHGTLSQDFVDVDKRIKNRLKNKINDVLLSLNVKEGEKKVKRLLGEEITFYNVNEVKKSVKKIFKQPLHLQNIHTLIILLDDLRNFYLRHKERNEINAYFDMLDKNKQYLDYNLGVSYFLRELDVSIKDGSDLSILDSNVKRIKDFAQSDKLIGGYKFKLTIYLVQHWMNVGEWEEAERVALALKQEMESGFMFSKSNLQKLLSLLATISNQQFNKEQFEYYKNESLKGDEENELLESELLDMKHLLSSDDLVINKETLERIEKVASKFESEKMNLYLRLVRTEIAIKEEDYTKAKNYNDVFFLDIHNRQVREYLDRIYIHRFIILYHKNMHEEIVRLFESKVTQKRILALERKGRQLIYPYVVYDLAKYKEAFQSKDEAFSNIFRILDYYQFNNYFECYKRISSCVDLAKEGLPLSDKQQLELDRIKNLVVDSLSK